MRVIEPIKISLDKDRSLLLTLGALKAAESELNKARQLEPRKAIFRIIMEELSQVDRGDVGIDFCEIILWAAMLHEEPNLLLDAVGLMPWDMREVLPLVIRLVTETYTNPGQNSDEEEAVISEEQKKNLPRLNGTQISGPSPESN